MPALSVDSEAVSVTVAAAMLGRSYQATWRLLRRGKLVPVYRADGHQWVCRQSLEAYAAQQQELAPAGA